MKIKSFLKSVLEKQEVNDNFKQVENKFIPLKIINHEAKKLIYVLNADPLFFDDDMFYRLLSLQEVLDCESDMNVPFRRIGLMPLIDCGDNDFICYDFRNHGWCKFNIAEEFKYSAKRSILDFFD
ncbi:MAG: hypothetical protein LUD27_05580 [Clostridia bacterium]|nr:hypothetical protein [Clostridia bacterium]